MYVKYELPLCARRAARRGRREMENSMASPLVRYQLATSTVIGNRLTIFVVVHFLCNVPAHAIQINSTTIFFRLSLRPVIDVVNLRIVCHAPHSKINPIGCRANKRHWLSFVIIWNPKGKVSAKERIHRRRVHVYVPPASLTFSIYKGLISVRQKKISLGWWRDRITLLFMRLCDCPS